MRRRLLLAALSLAAACGRFNFDVTAAPPGSDAADAPRNPVDVGVPTQLCPPRTPGAGTMVTTSTELTSAISTAQPGDTILLADGVYGIATTITITTPNLTIRSASNRANAATINGSGVAAPMFYVRASNVAFISLTIAKSGDEAIRVEPTGAGTADGTDIYDVTFVDHVGVAVRAKPFSSLAAGPFSDNGNIACSRFLHTTPTGCDGDGTFGIRFMGVRTWTVRDNYFAGQCSPTRVRAIWTDNGSRDVDIIGNVFSNNMNNIITGGVGLRTYTDALPAGCTGTPQHWGGVICNNRIAGLGVPSRTGADFDEGIALWSTCDTWVLHNTIVSPPGVETFENIEYRYPETYVHLINNLLAADPLARDSATIDVASTNVRYTSTTDFVDAPAGDLRLAHAIGLGAPISQCVNDAAGNPRNASAPTPGAFEP